MSSLRKNIIFLMVLQGSNYVIPLMTFPYLSRTLGPSSLGEYSVALSIAQYLILFTDFGFNMSTTQEISQSADKKNRSIIFISTLIAKFILLLISLFVLVAISSADRKLGVPSSTMMSFGMIVGSVFTPIWFFQGIEKIGWLTATSIISRSLSIPLVFALVKGSDDIENAIWIQSIVSLTSAVISIILVVNSKEVIFTRINHLDVINRIKMAWPLFVSAIAISLYTMSTPLILNMTTTKEQVGLFSGADKIRSAIMGCFMIIGNAIYPRVNNLFVTDQKKMYSLIKKVAGYQLIFTTLISIGVILMSDVLIKILLGAKFTESRDILFSLIPQFVFVPLSVVFGNYILLPHGHKHAYMYLPVVTAILHIILCYSLSMKFGAIGGALSGTIVECITLFCLICFTWKKRLFQNTFFN